MKYLVNIVLTVFAFVFAFTICEVTTRLLYKDKTILFPRYHTDYHYGRYTIRGIRPNSEYWMTSVDGSWKYITNSRGFRNTKDFSYDKPANTIRVLSLGDSNTQGYEVRQDFTFSSVLERFLNLHSKKNAEVINSGVSGFGNEEELVLLENEGVKYNPDVVVLGFFANDFEDNIRSSLFNLNSQGQLTEEKFQYIPGVRIQNIIYSIPGVKWLGENSYFYSLLFNKTWEYYKSLSEKRAKSTEQNSVPQAESAIPTRSFASEYQIILTATLIERMQKFCADRGIRFIVVDIPVPVSRFNSISSMPKELLEKLNAAHVEYISSQSLLDKFNGVAEINVPHGDHHISEFTQTLIGTEIGQRLLANKTQ